MDAHEGGMRAAYAGCVDPVTAATLAGLGGLGVGAAGALASRRPRQNRAEAGGSDTTVEREEGSGVTTAVVPPGVADVLEVLRSAGVVLDGSDAVVNCSPAAVTTGLVRDGSLAHQALLELARRVRRDKVIRETELELPKGPMGRARIVVHARVAPLGTDYVLLLVEDRTRARHVEQVRRDFVANVSHELKTPVGGIALLAEAVLDAHDDPEAVARFAKRISIESDRLSRLVREIVDFSRLQAGDAVTDPVQVDLVEVVAMAVERVRVLAEDKQIEIAVGKPVGPTTVWGEPDLLITALSNLLGNAVTYSDKATRVAVGIRGAVGRVTVTVTDQGVGIAESDQARIFERFYRVDAARSRGTGGSGLGLAIVRHVVENHGGEVTVWSQLGQGSTFTIHLPTAAPAPNH